MIVLIIGSHVSFKSGILSSVKEAISYNANTFMFYTGAPTNTYRSRIDEEDTLKAHELMQEYNIDINNVICHAPYILNLASKVNIEKYLFSISFLKSEIKRCEALGVFKIVVHPGNAIGISKTEGCKNISDAINMVLTPDMKITVLFETMAGKGSECGSTVEEMKLILDNIILKDKVGVCLDTCHINDAGYNLNNFDNYLELFDKLIGINKIMAVHINDSKNISNSHKDRHENIGFGFLGFDTIMNVIYHEKLKDVPKILETPYVGEYPPYKFEIAMIKNKIFDPELKAKIIDYYK